MFPNEDMAMPIPSSTDVVILIRYVCVGFSSLSWLYFKYHMVKTLMVKKFGEFDSCQ